MKKMIRHIAALLLPLLLLATSQAKAQFVLGEGNIEIGPASSAINMNYPCNISVNGYKGLLWNHGSNYLGIDMTQVLPSIYGANRRINFYNPNTMQYITVGVKSSLSFMYDPLTNGGTAYTAALNKVMGVDASVMAEKAVQDNGRLLLASDTTVTRHIGLTPSSLSESVPELTVTDEHGNQLVDLNSMVPLLVGAYQSLLRQAEAQDEQIKALKKAPVLRKVDAKTLELTGIEAIEEDSNRLFRPDPNPVRHKVTLSYAIASTAKDARLRFNDLNGRKLGEAAVTERGKGKLKVDASRWPAGVCFCSLIVDGKVVTTQKIIKK